MSFARSERRVSPLFPGGAATDSAKWLAVWVRQKEALSEAASGVAANEFRQTTGEGK